MANEVWLVTVPEKESIKRVMERDGRSEEEATKRLKSQMSSQDKAQHANVVLSTLWEPDITQKQVRLILMVSTSPISVFHKCSLRSLDQQTLAFFHVPKS